MVCGMEKSLEESLESLEESLEDSLDNASPNAPEQPLDESLEGSLEEDLLEESMDGPLDEPKAEPKAARVAETALAVAAEPAAEKALAGKAASAPAKGKHAKPAKQRSGKGLKIAFFSLLGVLLVAVGLGYGYYHGKISLLQFDDGNSRLDGTIDENDLELLERAAEMESAVEGLPIADPVFVESDIEKFVENPFDGKIVNILLLGTDERSNTFIDAARSDTTIICSVNLDTGAVKLISLERGMGVPVLEGRYQGEWDWLTHIFRYGGADLMMKTVSTVLDVDVQRYVRVNFNTFITLVDAMGGVDITLSQREADGLNTNIVAYNLDLCDWVHAGENHMNGFLALQYARMRKIDSDWVRVTRQRATIEAIMAKARTLSASELDDLLNATLPLIKTNLTEKEITMLLLKVPLFLDKMDVEGLTIPVQGTYGSMTGMGGRSLFAADFTANAKILHDMIYGDEESGGE